MRKKRLLMTLTCVTMIVIAAGNAFAQQPAPDAPPIPRPRDVPYSGVIHLSVDATDLDRGIYAVHENIPVLARGPMILLYPKWLPGDHAPRLFTERLAGLTISASGQKLAWRRDPVDMSAFHIEIPKAATALDINFQFLSPLSARAWPRQMSPNMLDIWWPSVTLYPAGYFARQITIEASVRLPEGFKLASALEVATSNGQAITFKPTKLDALVDSSVVAGLNLEQFDLDPGGPTRVRLDLFADRPEDLVVKPELIADYRALVQQAYKLFGSHHFDHYDFLLWLSDAFPPIGLEHSQSSEDGASPSYFQNWDDSLAMHHLLAHEFTHSWNGLYRVPAEMWIPNFNVPMRDSLLWVYEGLTQYWGQVLAARSGLMTRQQTLDAMAATAAPFDHQPGRAWRNLQDTTNDPILTEFHPQFWPTWQRNEDYYYEGEMIWLDVDTLIRKQSGGKRSLDDFAKAFFGVHDGSRIPNTYDFDSLVRALNDIQPYDWAGFFHSRLESNGPEGPLDGFARGGYRLVYDDTETDYFRNSESGVTDLSFSIGLTADPNGTVLGVVWEGQAFKAGLVPGMKIVSVNGAAYSADGLKGAIKAAVGGGPTLELAIKRNDSDRKVRIDYHDGLRYPRLERIADLPALLDDILKPRS